MGVFKKRSLLQSQRLVRRQQIRSIIKIIILVLLFVGFIWSLSYISFAQQLSIQHVLITGNSAVPTQDIADIANQALHEKFLWIFSRDNVLFYPKSEILNTLKYSYSWIDTISISKTNLNTIQIKIKERVPVAVWCGMSFQATMPCKLMDGQGYVFAPAPDFSGAAYLRLYGPLTSASWHGAQFFSDAGRAHIFAFNKGLTAMSITPVSVQVITASVKDEYSVFLQSGAYIDVGVSDDVASVISNLSSLLGQKIFAQSATDNFANLDYIDMRFGNKIFYKFKSTESTSVSTSTSTKI